MFEVWEGEHSNLPLHMWAQLGAQFKDESHYRDEGGNCGDRSIRHQAGILQRGMLRSRQGE